jgi:hypothetical protein
MTMTGRPWGLGAMAAALLAGLAGAAAAHEGHDARGAKGKTVTLGGDVVDLHCFLLHPETGQGPAHAACAERCIADGLPVGFKADDGTVYLLLGEGHGSVKRQVKGTAGRPVTVTGALVEHAGWKAIQVASVEPRAAKPAAKAQPPAPRAEKASYACPMGCVVADKPGRCPACGMEMARAKPAKK